MVISAKKFRQNFYDLLDRIMETGIPIEIEKDGNLLKILPDYEKSENGELKPAELMIEDIKEIIDPDMCLFKKLN